jgi:murein DD-endopeptidase MepM/ murein hydrolase activator NlpD
MSTIPRRSPTAPRASALPRAGPAVAVIAALVLVGSGGPARADQAGPGWRWPLTPRPAVLRGFAPPAQRWLPGHRGVDLAGQPGQPVLAAGPGRVTFASVLAGRGVVVVSHGAVRTTYQPVLATAPVGTVVRAGDQIGRLDVAGGHCRAEAPCLHWGVLRGRAYLDPLALVWGGHVRLLPLARDRPDVAGSGAAGSGAGDAGDAESPGAGRAGVRPGTPSLGERALLAGSPSARLAWPLTLAALAALAVRGWAGRVSRRRRARPGW